MRLRFEPWISTELCHGLGVLWFLRGFINRRAPFLEARILLQIAFGIDGHVFIRPLLGVFAELLGLRSLLGRQGCGLRTCRTFDFQPINPQRGLWASAGFVKRLPPEGAHRGAVDGMLLTDHKLAFAGRSHVHGDLKDLRLGHGACDLVGAHDSEDGDVLAVLAELDEAALLRGVVERGEADPEGVGSSGPFRIDRDLLELVPLVGQQIGATVLEWHRQIFGEIAVPSVELGLAEEQREVRLWKAELLGGWIVAVLRPLNVEVVRIALHLRMLSHFFDQHRVLGLGRFGIHGGGPLFIPVIVLLQAAEMTCHLFVGEQFGLNARFEGLPPR